MVVAIAGPTASGKSDLAHAVALACSGEIVVADPFQRYRGLGIASDAPGEAQRAEVPYHFVGDLDLHEASRAGEFSVDAHRVIDEILARGRVPVVTGGTGLYLRAALGVLDFSAPVPEAVRLRAEGMVASDLPGALQRLAVLDLAAATRVDRANPRRVARALEIAEMGGSAARASTPLWDARMRLPTVVFAPARPREELYVRIARRVRREIDDGLIEEIEAALAHPRGLSREAAQIIGVREVRQLMCGELHGVAFEEALSARTRRLARKQLTWLRKMPDVRWRGVGDADSGGFVQEVVGSFSNVSWT